MYCCWFDFPALVVPSAKAVEEDEDDRRKKGIPEEVDRLGWVERRGSVGTVSPVSGATGGRDALFWPGLPVAVVEPSCNAGTRRLPLCCLVSRPVSWPKSSIGPDFSLWAAAVDVEASVLPLCPNEPRLSADENDHFLLILGGRWTSGCPGSNAEKDDMAGLRLSAEWYEASELRMGDDAE